jgi:hypothetical protein
MDKAFRHGNLVLCRRLGERASSCDDDIAESVMYRRRLRARLARDTGDGAAPMLDWISMTSRSTRTCRCGGKSERQRHFSCSDFLFDVQGNNYEMPPAESNCMRRSANL